MRANMRNRCVRGVQLTNFECPRAAVGDLWIEVAKVFTARAKVFLEVGFDCTIVLEEQI